MRRRRPAFHRRWAPFIAAIPFAALAALAAFAAQARDDDERINLRAEAGVEYDSNVHRAEQISGATGPPVVASPLARVVLGWSVADRVAASQDVAFSLLGAAKSFSAPEARSENVAVVETAGSWRLTLGQRTRIGASAAYYEATQAGSPTEQRLSEQARDFRSLAPTLRIVRAVGDSGTITLGGGYRWFVYKPLRSYDFGAPVASLDYHLTRETADGGADWEASVGAGVELRRFDGIRMVPVANCVLRPCAAMPDASGIRHDDQFFAGHVDVMRTGRVLVGVGYAIQWNRSNSYAETLVRHVATVRFTAPLPLGLYLAARSELVWVTYADGVALAVGPTGTPSATIDDENRNHLRAELSRDISAHLQLIARYSLYVNALGQGNRYQRQTGTLSLAFTID